MKTVLMTLIIVAIIVIAGGLFFIYSGLYDISALKAHNGLTLWMIDTMKDHSIHYHAKRILVPSLSEPAMLKKGIMQYRMSCEGCHGGPGVEQSDIAKGLMPSPPDLKEPGQEWSPAELYWITENGIKLTGMPAWAHSLSNDDVWTIVVFVKKLTNVTPEDYK